jgi:hypothetical protein
MIVATVVVVVASAVAASHPVIAYDSVTQSVNVRGLGDAARLLGDQDSASRVLRVYLGDAPTAMLGDYRLSGDVLSFSPRFRFLPGRAYRVLVDLSGITPNSDPLIYRFRTAATAADSITRVTAIYPSANAVPANLLRMYIYFSRPMSRHGVLDHLRLVDGNGRTVEQAFLETEEGLWDREARRLTLFFHPGRIKSGVGLHERLGLALKPGGRYRLIVSKNAEDAEGRRLRADFTKEFRAIEEDRSSPDVHQWKIEAPVANTRGALVVDAEKSLDHVLFQRLLRVESPDGRLVCGTVSLSDKDERWHFVPEQSWQAGEYALRVAGELEDPAGNRPTRLFEEIQAPDGRRREASDVVVKFRPQE